MADQVQATIAFKDGWRAEIIDSRYRLYDETGKLDFEYDSPWARQNLPGYMGNHLRAFAEHLIEKYGPGVIWVDPRFEQPPDPNVVY